MMNRRVNLAVAWISVALCLTGTAKAMSILDFARMNLDDESTYVALLVEGTAKMLRAHGQADQARKAIALFKNSGKDGGVNQLAMNLKMLNGLNNRNAINPNNRAPVYEVEDAMELTLKDNRIMVPAGFLFTINRDFRPSGPPRSRITGQ